MSSALWDPANLLQITDDLRDQSGKISCLGITRNSARCRWAILEPDLSDVRPLLKKMSLSKPELITTDTLRRLARLCLCPKFHQHQAEQFVRHWTTIIKAAVQQHKNLTESMADATPDEVHSSQMDSDSRQRQYSESAISIKSLQSQLAAERESFAQLAATWKNGSEEVRVENGHLKGQLREVQDRLRTSEATMSHQTQSSQALMEKIGEESEARRKVDQENMTLQAKLGDMQDQLGAFEAVRTENNFLKQEVIRLGEKHGETLRAYESEVDKVKLAEEQLVTIQEAKDSTIHQYQCRIDEQNNHRTGLERRIAGLEDDVAQLEARIAACWLHAFWAWASRFGGRLGTSSRLPKTKAERVGEIALKTYA
ncbi:Reticulocyte-binding 2 a [Fusarium albosuccineum]|uniref:Reticulocyte-binding 2 a n=1 Tax=Fusarium albosuccineum TaxID=1237068 RepID=A0A8H4PFA6_9HYPO|nr:Reticulocyte-binding 2 a [Fusarium albosuccineum]